MSRKAKIDFTPKTHDNYLIWGFSKKSTSRVAVDIAVDIRAMILVRPVALLPPHGTLPGQSVATAQVALDSRVVIGVFAPGNSAHWPGNHIAALGIVRV